MKGLTPWAVTAVTNLTDENSEALYSIGNFKVFCKGDSLWIVSYQKGGGRIAFRAAFSSGSELEIKKTTENEDGIELLLASDVGRIRVKISLDRKDATPVLRYTTSLKPAKDLIIPYWPADILIPDIDENTEGKVHANQEGTRSGFIYCSMTKPKSGSFLYLQNLTALADYCEQTKTSCANVVGGNWPEMGFSLPPSKDKFLKEGKEVIISDAFVAFDEEVPADEIAVAQQFLNLLATVYLHLPLPGTIYSNWPVILQKGLTDLLDSPGCWSQVGGHRYFNAYVSDYKTPPEIMVQLAVILPLNDYAEWRGESMDVINTVMAGLPAFYNEKLGTVVRWLPAAEDWLEEEEEQKKKEIMDSWYLHHPLLNLSRMALKGNKTAKKLFLDSLDFCIKVAHHFKYKWPVFYNIDTLEVVKAETQPGKGGEHDVAGLYAHVMLQAWELTKEKRYLNEAEKAAKTLKGYGFDVFYQANNTVFTSGALLRLYKITKNKRYLDLSYMCLAAVFRNAQLWDCDYGYGKNFPTFFGIFPLKDAPYTAVYEEVEVFCAFHDYLKEAKEVEILPSVRLLIAEYIRYLAARAPYYYPPMLPKDMLVEKPKVGELDPDLWIALEDLQDGWEKCGKVGQEVYGAGNAFGIVPRHYMPIPGETFMVYVEYPATAPRIGKGRSRSVSFTLLGDERLSSKLILVKQGRPKLPEFTVTADGSEVKGKKVKDGNIQYEIKGNQQVKISWAHQLQ